MLDEETIPDAVLVFLFAVDIGYPGQPDAVADVRQHVEEAVGEVFLDEVLFVTLGIVAAVRHQLELVLLVKQCVPGL